MAGMASQVVDQVDRLLLPLADLVDGREEWEGRLEALVVEHCEHLTRSEHTLS